MANYTFEEIWNAKEPRKPEDMINEMNYLSEKIEERESDQTPYSKNGKQSKQYELEMLNNILAFITTATIIE